MRVFKCVDEGVCGLVLVVTVGDIHVRGMQ